MRTRGLALVLAAAAGCLFPSAAQACRTGYPQFLLHTAVPQLQADDIAAEVEIVTRQDTDRAQPVEARVLRMIQGDARISRIVVDLISTCDALPDAGARGIMVGKAVSRSSGTAVVAAIRRSSSVVRIPPGGE